MPEQRQPWTPAPPITLPMKPPLSQSLNQFQATVLHCQKISYVEELVKEQRLTITASLKQLHSKGDQVSYKAVFSAEELTKQRSLRVLEQKNRTLHVLLEALNIESQASRPLLNYLPRRKKYLARMKVTFDVSRALQGEVDEKLQPMTFRNLIKHNNFLTSENLVNKLFAMAKNKAENVVGKYGFKLTAVKGIHAEGLSSEQNQQLLSSLLDLQMDLEGKTENEEESSLVFEPGMELTSSKDVTSIKVVFSVVRVEQTSDEYSDQQL